MAVVPPSKVGLIEFCEAHAPVWTAVPLVLGLTPGQCTALTTATSLARSRFNAAEAARNASKAATLALDDACESLRDNVSLLVKTIKLFAENQPNPETVYVAAQIPAPAEPTTNPPPGKPDGFTFQIEPGGALTLRWKSTNSSSSTGANFTIARRFGSTGAFSVIGGTSSKVFTDDTIPVGSSVVAYIVTPRRNGQIGQPGDIQTVQFGVGGATLTVSSSANTLGLAA
jgi:hypothetical protein